MSLEDLVQKITTLILNPVITILFVLATIVFLWGVIQYIAGLGGGDEKKVGQGKKIMVWGIIGLFIMSAAWGIVRVLCDFFFGGGACPRTVFL